MRRERRFPNNNTFNEGRLPDDLDPQNSTPQGILNAIIEAHRINEVHIFGRLAPTEVEQKERAFREADENTVVVTLAEVRAMFGVIYLNRNTAGQVNMTNIANLADDEHISFDDHGRTLHYYDTKNWRSSHGHPGRFAILCSNPERLPQPTIVTVHEPSEKYPTSISHTKHLP